jgi:hypothetical protein
MLFTKKKYFDKIYLANNIDDSIIAFALQEPFTYAQFFVLTKLVHSAIIKFQINPFCAQTSHFSIFLLLRHDEMAFTTATIDTTYQEIKSFLTVMKKTCIRRHKILFDAMQLPDIDRTLQFIAELGISDNRYKQSSLFQVKSLYKRKQRAFKQRLEQDTSNINTTIDLIDAYYIGVSAKWSSIPYLPRSQVETIEDNNSVDGGLYTEIATFLGTVMEPERLLNSPTYLESWHEQFHLSNPRP